MEKRKYSRFETFSPMKYHLPVKGLGTTTAWKLKGVMKDISAGGFYFTSENRLWMAVGDTLDFEIDVSPLQPDPHDIGYLTLQGMVTRIEYLGPMSDPWGVGVKFQQPLLFS